MASDGLVESRYDVIVVGGRPAGAMLAARLGALGRKVLVIDKASLPSPPQVPSCPLLYPQAMAELAEVGIAEDHYAHGAVKIERFVFEFGGYWDATLRMVNSRGRDYVYGIDRARFDHVLWAHLARYPSVTARDRFAMTEIVRDESGRVTGIVGRDADGAVHRIEADWVVGADGRFSPLARKAGAKVVEDRPEHQSTVFFADWEGLAPFRDETEPIVHLYTTGRGTDVLFFPLTDGKITICTHQRADRVNTDGEVEAYYLREISAHPSVQRRMQGGRRVGPVLGMKRVANRYLQPGGPGWVLVGDALHHKDPVDGQGIYDALVEARVLAEALEAYFRKERTAEQMLAFYDRRVREETHPMFEATLARLKSELYGEPPVPVIRTVIRWMMSDPEYQERFLRYLCRDIDPGGWASGALIARASLRGVFGDLGRATQRLWGR